MKKCTLVLLFLAMYVSAGFAQVEMLQNGNVGIGTTNPQHRLDVVGDVRVSGDLIFGSMNLTSGVQMRITNQRSSGIGTERGLILIQTTFLLLFSE